MRVVEFLHGWSHITWFELHNIPIKHDKYMNNINTWKLYIYIILHINSEEHIAVDIVI